LKTLSKAFFAFLISISILAPTVIEIVDMDFGTEISENLGDEETEKEGEDKLEEFEEKKLIVSSLDFGVAFKSPSEIKNSFNYQEKTLDLISSIVLPPPEKV